MTEDQEKELNNRLNEIQKKIVIFLMTLGISEQECIALLCKTMVEFCMLLKISKPIILSRVSETYEILDNLYQDKFK
jgi:hypothetical protein